MRIGILGGTFDPPHIGHQILAAEAMEQVNLDQVLWILTPFPPHKTNQNITPLVDRVRMVELAIDDNPCFILSSVDIERQPPHYAVDTMAILKSNSPNDDYYYLLGLDSLNDLPTWHRPVDFVDLCSKIVVMLRDREDLDISKLEAEIPGIRKKLCFLKAPLIEISGTEIRIRVEKGKQYRYFVPEKVYQYIFAKKIYQD
jgi:nicotinate-nucleotide adenylyltransferase